MELAKKKWKLIWLASALAALGLAGWQWRANLMLAWSVRSVAREFRVNDINADSLSALMAADKGDLLILDTRTPDEFNLSRIDGAVRVDWQLDGQQFDHHYGEIVRGRKVVLYCSIGYRSSALLKNIRAALDSNGAGWAANLSGGIFGWYNAGRPLVDSSGAPTDTIHPYDRNWGRLVKQR